MIKDVSEHRVSALFRPAVVPQQVHKVQRRQRCKQVFHVEEYCKAEGSRDILSLLYESNGPQQDACAAVLGFVRHLIVA